MLLRLIITNFLSFGEETEFNLFPTNSLRNKREHIKTINKDVEVLKASVMYGANGAGKSNLIKAVDCLKRMVESGHVLREASIQKNKTKLENLSNPTTIELEFSVGSTTYSYGVSYDASIVHEEWLYRTTPRRYMVFERNFDPVTKSSVIKMDHAFTKSEKNQLLIRLFEENLLKNDHLLLSSYDKMNSEDFVQAYNWISKKLFVVFPYTKSTSVFDDRYSDDRFRTYAESMLGSMNVGVSSLMLKSEDVDNFKKHISDPNVLHEIEMVKNELDMYTDKKVIPIKIENDFTISIRKEDGKCVVRRVVTRHKSEEMDMEFELNEESDGTQRVFELVPLSHNLHFDDSTFLIDEIDRSLHPSLVRAFVSRVMNDNESEGQLIFTTHESSLLSQELFRNDEIWFAEKSSKDQCTQIYPLSDFKPRTDLNLEKGYLAGRFGAIPFLARLEDLKWE